IIGMKEIIPLMEKVFTDYTSGRTITPLRTKISVEQHGGDILFMPAYIPEGSGLGVKVVSVFPGNSELNRQTIYSMLILNDDKTGEPIALMDAERLTALRTGAVSGVAAKYLSREDSETVTVFGAGIQARTQLEAICCVRSIRKVFVAGRNFEHSEGFSREIKDRYGVEATVCKDTVQALKNSDIVITATTSHTPVFDGRYIQKGAFVTAVGAYTPKMQEIPENHVSKAVIIVDAYSAALKEAGDIIIPMGKGLISRENIRAELGEVVLGKYERENEDEIIFFKSVGLAIQDMCVAPEIYRRAVEKGFGVTVEI
ncbi:MAG: ornithine cyclodeaminase family protein, partial [Pseudomonadota bacterium]